MSRRIAAKRIASIDIMRGLVIALMMMDHVRERFYMHVRTGDPIHSHIEPDLFFTRMATHLCAPIFIFLAGLGAWLYAHPHGKAPRSPSSFLFKRGLAVLAIELVLYYLVWVDSFPSFLFLQVLWAIGLCMLGLALASKMRRVFVGGLGLLIVVGHNALDSIALAPGEWGYSLWTILLAPGKLAHFGSLTVSLSYPALPWFGVILIGYFVGPLFARTVQSDRRRRILFASGIGCLAVLGVLRGLNLYGEAIPWFEKATTGQTIMAWMNFTKYPPSLCYLLLTLGIGLLLMAGLETANTENRVLRVLEVFGSIPMFVYVVHLYVLLAAYWVLFLVFGSTQGERFGFASVPWIWLGTMILIVALYPLARRFSAYKHREKRNRPWLSYF